MEIRLLFKAEFEDTGKWPTGHRKIELIDKAVYRAEATLERRTRIDTVGGRKPQAERTERPLPAASAPSKVTRKIEVLPGVFKYLED